LQTESPKDVADRPRFLVPRLSDLFDKEIMTFSTAAAARAAENGLVRRIFIYSFFFAEN